MGELLAPGEIVVVYGSGMGPGQLVQFRPDSAGLVATSLAGTQVFFNGIPAPLFFVLPDDPDGQIIAQLPSELVGPTATVEVSTDW